MFALCKSLQSCDYGPVEITCCENKEFVDFANRCNRVITGPVEITCCENDQEIMSAAMVGSTTPEKIHVYYSRLFQFPKQ